MDLFCDGWVWIKRSRQLKMLIGVVPFLIALQISPSVSHGGWFTTLVDKVPDMGGGGGAQLGDAGIYVAKLAKGSRGHAIAASVSDVGHWHLMNGAGEKVTVSGTDELEGAMKWLVSDQFNANRQLITFYIEDAGLLRNPEFLKILPSEAQRVIVSRGKSYRVFFKRTKGEDVLYADLRDGLDVRLGRVEHFREIVWQMETAFGRSNVRLLSLRQNAAKELPKIGIVGSGGLPEAEEVDPYFLKSVLSSLRGQTVLIMGRVKDDLLYFQPSGASGLSIFLADMGKAARASDVRLVVLNTGQSRQPGERDWLWRKVGIAGLEAGLAQSSFGDFLNIVGKGRGGYEVSIGDVGASYKRVKAGPKLLTRGVLEHDDGPDYDGLGATLTDVMAAIKGDMVVAAVLVEMPSAARQSELDVRIIPGIPSLIQYLYLGSLVLGLIGFVVAQSWWHGLWPPENVKEYRTRAAYGGALGLRAILFGFIFIPVVGIAAFFVSLRNWLGAVIKVPLNWIGARNS